MEKSGCYIVKKFIFFVTWKEKVLWVWNMSVKTSDLSTNGTHSIHWADYTVFHMDNLGNGVCLGFWIKAGCSCMNTHMHPSHTAYHNDLTRTHGLI